MESAPPLPYLTAKLPGVGGVLRAAPEDFRVDELPAYEPVGEGEHVYVHFEKRGMTTPYAIEQMARVLRVSPRDIGYAGMKDRHAVTTQWVSIPRVDPAAVEAMSVPDLRVLTVSRHRNKLRTGHLHGNRFVIRVTAIADLPLALERASGIATELQSLGCPNFYGEQRFGRDGDNALRGLAWLRGESDGPREHFQRKLQVSAAQSELFNRWLTARVEAGELGRYVDGDLAIRHPVGRPWLVEPAEAQSLYDTHAASATGPMFGTQRMRPGGEALRREEAVLTEAGLGYENFSKAGDLGEGTRRAARVLVDDLSLEADGDALRLSFTLPAGAYATVVLRELMKDG